METPTLNEMESWLLQIISAKTQSLESRLQAAEAWIGHDDAWKAAGNTMTKEQRKRQSEIELKIANKIRRDLVLANGVLDLVVRRKVTE